MATTKKGPITKATTGVAIKADKALEKGVDAYEGAKEATTARYDAARTKVVDRVEGVKAKALETHENARVYVQENPEKSVAVSAGVGVLVGAVLALLITRRR
jgi:ElaB/YqjD/DUF883 family membrane-anchored ribosome-binding protein